jgi:hypothetical protein
MNIQEFRQVLTSFADKPADVSIEKGRLLAEVHESLIEATVAVREGSVIVTEGAETVTAERWITHRIARLPLLADRIIDYTRTESSFVTPSALLLDSIDEAPSEEPREVEDAAVAGTEVLGRRPAGTSSVLYLTSDAGEGKTTLINELALAQARAFKRKESDWLLVPVSLGGRPFMRLDDVIISGLVNKYRFSVLYYDAFLELVRLGVLVPALDGFEEMFVESASGEAMSALGNLIQLLNRSGTVLIAARKAFFEYKNLEAQARLLDALGSASVAFARLALQRWNRTKFVEYCRKRGVAEGEQIFEDVAVRLGATHPMLTRAVLVKRLLDVAQDKGEREALLRSIQPGADEFFPQFVDAIIQREAAEKWIAKSGEPRVPLLSVQEHHELLSMVAMEMWESRVDALSASVLDPLAELYAEQRGKTPDVARQCVDRLKHHALIVQAGETRAFGFDHEEFRYFFLGEAIGRAIVEGRVSDLRASLRVGTLPRMALDGAASSVRRAAVELSSVLGTLTKSAEGEGAASFTRENAGALVAQLLALGITKCEIQKLTFPPDSLGIARLEQVRFTDCYFQQTTPPQLIRDTLFVACEFDRIEIGNARALAGVTLQECLVHSVVREDETPIFDPERIKILLANAGAVVRDGPSPTAQLSIPDAAPRDAKLALATRVLRGFMRSTELNEGTLRSRAGKAANEFIDEVLPRLLAAGILKEVSYLGSGTQRRFRLGLRMADVKAREGASEGNFDAFVGGAQK